MSRTRNYGQTLTHEWMDSGNIIFQSRTGILNHKLRNHYFRHCITAFLSLPSHPFLSSLLIMQSLQPTSFRFHKFSASSHSLPLTWYSSLSIVPTPLHLYATSTTSSAASLAVNYYSHLLSHQCGKYLGKTPLPEIAFDSVWWFFFPRAVAVASPELRGWDTNTHTHTEPGAEINLLRLMTPLSNHGVFCSHYCIYYWN